MSGVMTAVAAAAAAEKETPDGDGQSARCHADPVISLVDRVKQQHKGESLQADADAGDDANEDGQ